MTKEEKNLAVTEMESMAEREIPVKDLVSIITLSWPLIRLALKLSKVFTGPKADAKIDQIIKDVDELI